MNELQVKLSADISALQSALTKAKSTIKSFESETAKESEKGNVGFKRKIGLIEQLTQKSRQLRVALSQATNERQVEQYNQELQKTEKELVRLNALGRAVGASLNTAGNGFGKLATKGANANGVAIEFNRIIQDAPFGLIGIGNNLQQLAGNFSNVSKQAGGAGKAIVASLGAIVSPINLGLLAISALTAGFTAYQAGKLDWLLGTEDMGDAAEKAAEKLDDYRNSLDAVTRANIEGAANAEKEVQSFQLLKAQAESANIPLKDRIEAVQELKTEYPDYLGNLTQEQILTGNVGNAYKNLTQQIIATAKARAASDAIAENSLKSLTIEERTQDRISEILSKRAEIEKANAVAESLQGKAGENARIEREAAIGRAIRLENEILELSKEQISDVSELGSINAQNEKLTESISKNIAEGARFTEDQKKGLEGAKQKLTEYEKTLKELTELGLKIQVDFEIEFDKNRSPEETKKRIGEALSGTLDQDPVIVDVPITLNFNPEEKSSTVIGSFIDQIKGRVESLGDFQKALRDAGITSDEFFAGIESGAFEGLEQYDKFIDNFIKTNELLEDATKALENGISNTVGDMAFAIGDALANGGNALEAGGAALLGGLASILNQLGQLAIATGVAILGIKKALQTLNPVVAIAAGVALVALAGFVGAKAKSLGGGIGGGGSGSASASGGGAGVAAGAPPQIFTNKNTATVPTATSPNYTESSNGYDMSKQQGRLTVDLDIDVLRFGLEMNEERKKAGG